MKRELQHNVLRLARTTGGTGTLLVIHLESVMGAGQCLVLILPGSVYRNKDWHLSTVSYSGTGSRRTNATRPMRNTYLRVCEGQQLWCDAVDRVTLLVASLPYRAIVVGPTSLRNTTSAQTSTSMVSFVR